MLLTCPHCETIFRVDAADIKSGGRRVRCSVCTYVWLATWRGADVITGEADNEDQLTSWRGIIMAVALVAVLITLMTMNRNFIAANAPWTRPLYQAVGISTTSQLDKLEIARLNGIRMRDTIRVTGEVINLSDWAVLAPALLVTVTDNFGLVLGERTITIDQDIIEGGMSISFSAQVNLEQNIDDDDITEIVVTPTTLPSS